MDPMDPSVQKNQQTGAGNDEMGERLKALYKKVDEAVEEIRKGFSKEVRCKPGCSDCCHAVFDVSLAEAVAIQKAFMELPRAERRLAIQQAKKAMEQWNRLMAGGADEDAITHARIRCPLLNRDDLCMLYQVRPVNCRTYGVPLEMDGRSAVCGLCGFRQGRAYPTIKIGAIQDELLDISLNMDKLLGRRRWPIAALILEVS